MRHHYEPLNQLFSLSPKQPVNVPSLIDLQDVQDLNQPRYPSSGHHTPGDRLIVDILTDLLVDCAGRLRLIDEERWSYWFAFVGKCYFLGAVIRALANESRFGCQEARKSEGLHIVIFTYLLYFILFLLLILHIP